MHLLAYLALTGGTIYVDPSSPPIRNGVVLIQEGRIAAVGRRGSVKLPQGAEAIDCRGLTILAGFWNSHVHFMERKWDDAANLPAPELTAQLQAMLGRWGFTSVFDTGSTLVNTLRLRDRVERGEVAGPRIRTSGEILLPKGGVTPPELLDALGFMRVKVPEISNAEEAAAAARAVFDGGADAVKLYAATWFPPFVSLPEAVIKAAAEEAHRRSKPVLVHPTNRAGLLAAVRAGADVVVHTTPQSGAWDDEIIGAMKQRGVALIPTLKLWSYELRHDRDSARARFAAAGAGQLRAWTASGGAVLFGTDVGYMNDYDPAEEYARMAEAGMSFPQILASLTTAPARKYGEAEHAGRIAEGFAADITVIGGDPARDIRALAAVRYTIRGGRFLYR